MQTAEIIDYTVRYSTGDSKLKTKLWVFSLRANYTNLYSLYSSSLSAMLVPTFADRGCHMVSVKDP
jgi:hypothetical protein